MAMQVVQVPDCTSAAPFGIACPLGLSSETSCLPVAKLVRASHVTHGTGSVVARKSSATREQRSRRRGGRILARASSEPGDNESKAVYDAFFLGKALAETINERVGSALGEFLSDVGRRQAEQQKQIREFQDEVQQRAADAALKAAQKALATERSTGGTQPSSSTSPSGQPPPSTSGLSNPEDAPSSIP